MSVLRQADRTLPILRTDVSARARGVFLHSGWRSRGTWMWERLRESPTVRAFYEPLHEGLADLDSKAISAFRPDSWSSGHGAGAPYFAEYAPLLGGRRGVARFRKRFAFDRFFMEPDEEDDQLEAYIHRLVEFGCAEGRLPVLKFCRSLGRVGWMQRRFPDALHAVILRDPVGQWCSARQQMEGEKNRYFVLAPFFILARNAHEPLLVDAMDRLEVRVPPVLGADPGLTVDTCWRHVLRLSWAERYRGFLAFWAASAVAALSADAEIIDADAVARNGAHSGSVEAALSQAAGLPDCLSPSRSIDARVRWRGTKAEADDAARAALAAAGFVMAHRDRLTPARTRLLTRKLTPDFEMECGCVPSRVFAPSKEKSVALHPRAWNYVDAVAYVAAARATYPLRRVHFHIRRWWDSRRSS